MWAGKQICVLTVTGVTDRTGLLKLTVPQLVKKAPTLYGTQRFIAVLSTAHNLSLS